MLDNIFSLLPLIVVLIIIIFGIIIPLLFPPFHPQINEIDFKKAERRYKKKLSERMKQDGKFYNAKWGYTFKEEVIS